MITYAAIKTTDGKVWTLPRPARHSDILAKIHYEKVRLHLGCDALSNELLRDDYRAYLRDHVSGFVDDAGNFLDRDQAWTHVKACGQQLVADRRCSATGRQIPPDEVIGSILTSEDLW